MTLVTVADLKEKNAEFTAGALGQTAVSNQTLNMLVANARLHRGNEPRTHWPGSGRAHSYGSSGIRGAQPQQ